MGLTFANPGDFEKVQEADKVSVLGIGELAPGKSLTGELLHLDGSRESIELKHTLNKEQIFWFQAGSSLNYLRTKGS